MNARTTLLLVLMVFLGSGCKGKVVIPSAEDETATDCVGDDCPSEVTCTPLAIGGSCPEQSSCITGACYGDGDVVPSGCSQDANGWCSDDSACVVGVCTAVDAQSGCSSEQPEGLCPGGEHCVRGQCFDEIDLLCSASVPLGVCAPGSVCTGGMCLESTGTCSDIVPDGTCSAWEACVRGECIGPVAPDACSPAAPTGRCPADAVCLAGTCTDVAEHNVCSIERPGGLCGPEAACVGGYCIALTETNECSSENPDGFCPGAGTCQNGICVQLACEDGGFLCPVDQYCDGQGTCQPYPCDSTHPQGICDDSTHVCIDGLCAEPDCSPDFPDGVCAEGFGCVEGECILLPCSPEVPFGVCDDGFVCDDGTCVEEACSPDYPTGYCNESVALCHPDVGCDNLLDAVCCDDGLNSVTGCSVGVCSAPACSADELYGACPDGEYCAAGSCEVAPCSPYYPNGPCEDELATCRLGQCTRIGCSDESDPDGYCAPMVCDLSQDQCITPPCSVAYPTGTCALGTTCCSDGLVSVQGCDLGTCFVPVCSANFPGGACPDGQVCAAGSCSLPPCSSDYPTGACGPNLLCESGICVQAPCSEQAPQGLCDAGERCIDGTCRVYACSSSFPTGPCPVGSLCEAGVCVTPACSDIYPGGACAEGQVCVAGECILTPCSQAYPAGACGSGFTCDSGFCVPAPCSVSNPTGACDGADAGRVCVDGICVEYLCSATFPDGPCEPGRICDTSSGTPTCVVPPCSPTHVGGACEGAGEVCVGGECIIPACSPTILNGSCPSNQRCCDELLASSEGCELGSCVLAPCSPDNLGGRCDAGEVCCNEDLSAASLCSSVGSCFETPCSSTFPYGACLDGDAGKICVGGVCQDPCDDGAPSGWCPAGFACVDGACALGCDGDLDCDGILDTDEDPSGTLDTDSDGAPDVRDRDSDGDGIADAVEAGDLDPSTPPLSFSDGDVFPDFQDVDSDGDFIPDALEVGPSTRVPLDTDGDGFWDMRDRDSDADGITDRCEAIDVGGICLNDGLLAISSVLDTDGDGLHDYIDLDSDNDGISDTIEARVRPHDASSLSQLGTDHDSNGIPDYREIDSDGDGVLDRDEDVNGDGIVNCQVDGEGVPVADVRSEPSCSDGVYDYNPGCPTQKCLLAESSRVHADTDRDGISDGDDGVAQVCSEANLKPVNVFQMRFGDYALTLDENFDETHEVTRAGMTCGLRFDDDDTSHGSYGVSGFLVNKVPDAGARNLDVVDAERELIEKALAQASIDAAGFDGVGGVSSVQLVINRNFRSFDGYGVVVSRYRIETNSTFSVSKLRDRLVQSLDSSLDSWTVQAGGPTSTDFTLLTETRYRYDAGADGAVVVVGALLPTGDSVNDTDSYSYRTLCSEQSSCSSRRGCVSGSGGCVEDPDYQLPLFYADNIANGSALAQFGDDVAALCQSVVQSNGKLDVLWVVDNSGSMGDEIAQVSTSSELFFELLGKTEADYRVGQTTSQATDYNWPPLSRFDDPTGDSYYSVTDQFSAGHVSVNGFLRGGFTGAIAGVSDAGQTDRSSYCISSGSYDPACYFNDLLPGAYESVAYEYGLVMGQWAAFRSGAAPICDGLDSSSCSATSGCAWDGSTCGESRCAGQGSGLTCDGIPACARLDSSSSCSAQSGCSWNGATCNTSTCNNLGSEGSCNANQACAWSDGTCVDHTARYCGARSILGEGGCEADPRCHWYSWSSIEMCVSDYCAQFDEEVSNCDADSRCASYIYSFCVDEIVAGDGVECEWNSSSSSCEPSAGLPCWLVDSSSDCGALAPRCDWSNGRCQVSGDDGGTLCSGLTQSSCENAGGSFDGSSYCQWNASSEVCETQDRYAFRGDAARVMVVLSDEEACSVRDGAGANGTLGYNGVCDWFGAYAEGITPYDHDVRAARMGSFIDFFGSRGFTVYAITGDKADPSASAGSGNGGCVTSSNTAEAGQAYIDVAEATGGGWGSICAADLYPSIESIVIGSIAKASPYRLEGFINGVNVQPIPATIEVVVEVCDIPTQYPYCTGGTHMEVVPRSRDNGWDYDAVTNALVLYGAARPALEGDVTVSYRYWVDEVQAPEGNTDCFCPETSSPSCACPDGMACGESSCDAIGSSDGCEATPGCSWLTADGGRCIAHGRCEPDPTCGGGCGAGEVCDATTGLCACDLACGDGCAPGQSCDNDVDSSSCGQCVCDTSCGGGCAAGQFCDSDSGSPSCGQCACDTTCGGGCESGLMCDSDPNSPSCGFCAPPQCGSCPSGFACDLASGLCICDTTCGGGCPSGTTCDPDGSSETCGQCICDPTCGGDCPTGTMCDGELSSDSCGLCQVDPLCGVGGACDVDCDAGGNESNCGSIAGCRWAWWNQSCVAESCSSCNPSTGICEADANSCSCGPDEVYQPLTLACECDTTCGFSCAPGLQCDSDADSGSCGQCVCDVTCGGDCPQGLVCDDNSVCSGLGEGACGAASEQCAWEAQTEQCLSIFCGLCVVDPTCGGCDDGEICNPVTGLCEPECPACEAGTICDPLTGACICDQTCGGSSCPVGSVCDSELNSASCGVCVCENEAPASGCPQGQLFDDGSYCESLGIGGTCQDDPRCVVDAAAGACISPTCGQCVLDPTCGGSCPPGFICDPLSGLCIPDPNCGGCPPNFECDRLTGVCVPLGG